MPDAKTVGAASLTGPALPSLPPLIVGRPFGIGETGQPIREVRGLAIRATVDYMLQCVRERAWAALPPGAAEAERQASTAAAEVEALQQLVDRLNAALPDVHDHISGDYLLNAGNSYSFEFDTFLTAYCRQLAGDPQFDFHLGFLTLSPAIIRLLRPFTLHQMFAIAPRFISMFISTDLRVIATTRTFARIQWRDQIEHDLPEPVRIQHIWSFCQHLQGSLASVPQVMANQPPAEIQELQCQMRGDECCEWEFRWHKAGHSGLFRPGRGGRHSSKAPSSGFDEDLVVFPAPNPITDTGTISLPPMLQGRPFGADPDGQPIRHVRGSLARAGVEQMQDYLALRLAQELPAEMPAEERRVRINQAREAALDQLVERLNAFIPDPAYRVTGSYLLNEANYYSHEFEIYKDVLASQICGDPDFSFHRGMRSIPSSLVIFGRPFPIRQVYHLVPRFTAMVTDDDVRCTSTTSNSAIIQVHAPRTLAKLPTELHRVFLHQACQAYQGAYMMIPRLLSGQPPAGARELRCTLRGDEYCEWEFTWQPMEDAGRNGLALAGLTASLGLMAFGLIARPEWPLMAWLGALLPGTAGWLSGRARHITAAREAAERLVWEQREQAEVQYNSLQDAHASLQVSSIALKQKVSELTALHEIGLAVSATLDLDTLLERSLRAVTTHLAFDRAMILLVDEGRHVLSHGSAIGGGPGADELIHQAEFSLDDPDNLGTQIIHSGKPLLVTDLHQLGDAGLHPLIRALRTQSFLAVPLSTQGKVLGVLLVDNALTGKPIYPHADTLLLTAGSEIAAAVENLQLLTTLEHRVSERTSELKESEQRLADIIDFLPDATFVIDREGKVIAWNRAIEKMTGVKAQDMLGKGEFEYALPFYGERRPILIDLVNMPETEVAQSYSQIRMEGQILVGESYVPYLRENGTYVMGTASALHDSRGQIAGAIEVIRDLTERKRMEDELEREKNYLESLLTNSPTAIVVLDLNARVLSWNPAAERLFGYTAAEAVGHVIGDLIATEKDLQVQASANTQAVAASEMIHLITRRCRKDGSLVDVELLAVPVHVEGKLLGTLAIYHDITDLQHARQEAEAATQAKSAFLATMSHEIRTPMNAIIGMCGLLMDTPLNLEQREFAETIRSSGDALLTIINDILDFSKIEAGKMELERQPFDLQECIESALDLVKLKAAEKSLELVIEMAGDVPPAIRGDVTRLRQVLVNLLNNAVKFTETGEVVVQVTLSDRPAVLPPHSPEKAETGAQAPATVRLHFSVRDTGIGIPADRLDCLFQAFTQVDSSTTRKYGGTGLGLAVSKRLSEMMGGTMWVESEGAPGKGSTFHFTIEAPVAIEQASRAWPIGEAPGLRGRRVLIVDSSPTSLRILTMQAHSWGMQAYPTGSSQEALDWLRRGERFDAALLDLRMPTMDGVELARSIQEFMKTDSALSSPAPVIPLILLSSLGKFDKEIPEGLFTARLSKPIRASALFEALLDIFLEQPKSVPITAPTKTGTSLAERLPLRILLVEDNVVNQKLAVMLLGKLGYRPDVAANGLEAIFALERQSYDVLLMDVQMPEMDGLEATRRICARWPQGERPRIIAMTANAMQGDREMCLEAGMDDYVSKPIRRDELYKALERCHPSLETNLDRPTGGPDESPDP